MVRGDGTVEDWECGVCGFVEVEKARRMNLRRPRAAPLADLGEQWRVSVESQVPALGGLHWIHAVSSWGLLSQANPVAVPSAMLLVGTRTGTPTSAARIRIGFKIFAMITYLIIYVRLTCHMPGAMTGWEFMGVHARYQPAAPLTTSKVPSFQFAVCLIKRNH